MSEVQISQLQFREAMSQYASGVTIVSAIVDGKPAGFTCQSFHSVSLDPMLVSFNVKHSSTSWPVIRRAATFSINILSTAQMATSQAFGRSDVNRWDFAEWMLSDAGTPHLNQALLCIDCLHSAEHEAGDHSIIVAKIIGLTQPACVEDRNPLLFYRGRYHGVAAL